MNYEQLKKLSENISLILESDTNVFYHGSTHKITKFVDDFVGKGNDQYGPGIYFSSSKEDTLAYSGNDGIIYKCQLDLSRQLTTKSQYNENLCKKLMVSSPDEYAYTDWADTDDRMVAATEAMKNYVSSYGHNMYEIIMSIWYDWYREYPQDFVRNLSSMGYDCTTHDSNGGTTFVVVYNPSIITLLDSKPASEVLADL